MTQNFLDKHFNRSVRRERESILKDFLNPNVDSVITLKLGGGTPEK